MFLCADYDADLLQELDEMKKRLKEMEEEAAALREMQAKVEKEMGAVQGNCFLPSFCCCCCCCVGSVLYHMLDTFFVGRQFCVVCGLVFCLINRSYFPSTCII